MTLLADQHHYDTACDDRPYCGIPAHHAIEDIPDGGRPGVIRYDAATAAARRDAAIDRATDTLWRLLPGDVQDGYDRDTVRRWATAVADAYAAPADPATPATQCGVDGPDGLTCGRAPGHPSLIGDVNDHAAYADESGELVSW